MSGYLGFPYHRLPVANPGAVSSRALALVDTVAEGMALEPPASKGATLAASSVAQVLFAVVKRHKLTRREADAAAGLAVKTLAEQGFFDQQAEG